MTARPATQRFAARSRREPRRQDGCGSWAIHEPVRKAVQNRLVRRPRLARTRSSAQHQPAADHRGMMTSRRKSSCLRRTYPGSASPPMARCTPRATGCQRRMGYRPDRPGLGSATRPTSATRASLACLASASNRRHPRTSFGPARQVPGGVSRPPGIRPRSPSAAIALGKVLVLHPVHRVERLTSPRLSLSSARTPSGVSPAARSNVVSAARNLGRPAIDQASGSSSASRLPMADLMQMSEPFGYGGSVVAACASARRQRVIHLVPKGFRTHHHQSRLRA